MSIPGPHPGIGQTPGPAGWPEGGQPAAGGWSPPPPPPGPPWTGQQQPPAGPWAGQPGVDPQVADPQVAGPWVAGPWATDGRQPPGPVASVSSRQTLVQVGGIGGAVLFLAAALIPVSGKMPIVGTPAWTLFGLLSATAAAFGVVTARPGAPAGSRLVGQVGAGGMALFWVLIGVPAVPNTNSLLITLGAAASGAAVWLSTRDNP